jgi:putative aminopeptidase FrvX
MGHARQWVQRLKHECIGPEHMLLGVLEVDGGVAGDVLKNLGIDYREVREAVLARFEPGDVDPPVTGQVPFTPSAKEVLEATLDEAHGLGHNYIGTEHVLLGLMRVEGLAGEVLAAAGLDLARARAEIVELLGAEVTDVEVESTGFRLDGRLAHLLKTPGIPGAEDLVRETIRKWLPEDAVTDAMGNLVATVGRHEPAIIFVAHMDEIGFVVSEVREDGFLKLKPLGGIDPRTVFGRAFRILTETAEITGVATVTPPHLMVDRAKEMGEVPAVIDLLIDVGASSRAEAEALGVRPLQIAVLRKGIHLLNGKYVCARGLDDRVGCYILLRAFEELSKREEFLRRKVHFAFSVQEEVGLRGAQLLARKYPVEQAFAVDSVSAADFPGVRDDLGSARLGEGPCLRVLDNASIVPRGFIKRVEAIAEAASIPLQVVFTGGGTDARAFQGEGPHIMPLAIPMRYTHSAVEMVHLGDVEQTIKLVVAIAESAGK